MKRLIHAIVLATLLGGVCAAQTANDGQYTKEIRENTTEPSGLRISLFVVVNAIEA